MKIVLVAFALLISAALVIALIVMGIAGLVKDQDE